MPKGKGTYGSKVGRPQKKAAFKTCSSCKSPAKCKKAGRCMGKKK